MRAGSPRPRCPPRAGCDPGRLAQGIGGGGGRRPAGGRRGCLAGRGLRRRVAAGTWRERRAAPSPRGRGRAARCRQEPPEGHRGSAGRRLLTGLCFPWLPAPASSAPPTQPLIPDPDPCPLAPTLGPHPDLHPSPDPDPHSRCRPSPPDPILVIGARPWAPKPDPCLRPRPSPPPDPRLSEANYLPEGRGLRSGSGPA